jgi:hypothetical protein
MAALKARAQQKLFNPKKSRVHIAPLSVGDVNAIAFTVMDSSSRTLLSTALASKEAKGIKHPPDPTVFAHIISDIVARRKGSLYAALVTSIDVKEVFHPDRFAMSVARLGIVDELKSSLAAENYGPLGDLIATRTPYFWSDLISREISTVRKEVSTVVQRIFARFHESITTPELADELLESVIGQQQSQEQDHIFRMSPKAQLIYGADAFEAPYTMQQAFLGLFRKLSQTQRMGLLDPNSTIEGTFETFHQHLLMDSGALQRILPKAKFSGVTITGNGLQKIFRDSQLTRKLQAAFVDAYDQQRHDIPVDNLYRAMTRRGIPAEIARSAKTQLNITLSDSAISAITSGVVGLFFAFAGDTKGQSFPQIQSLKKR